MINAAVIAVFAALLIPMVTKDDRDFGKKDLIRTISFWALFSLLFVGVIVYPLSDLFAVMNIFAAMFFLKRSLETDKTAVKFITVFISGVFCYFAYNTRTIYLFACYTVPVIYIIIRLCGQKEKKIGFKRLLLTGAEIITGFFGAVAAAIPQIIMNKINLDKFSMSVPTSSLMLSQMFWGIKFQRYDTYMPVTADELHPNPQVFFMDSAGIRILDEMHMADFANWGDFFSLFIHHPVDVIMIYVRHLVNYVFPCWPTVYVTDLNNSKWLWGLLGFTMFFLTAFIFIRKCLKSYKNLVYFIPVLVPAILIIPGAVEYRFSIPLYLFALCQLFFNADLKKIKDDVIAHKWSVLFIYLAGAMLCFTIWSDMLASESVTPLLF